MATIKSEILSRNFIKPSTPTPPCLKTHKLSLLDQLSTSIHGNMTFFYPSNPNNIFSTCNDFFNKSHLLQAALSKTLTVFYPFSGRLIDAFTVDCNDKGVFFVEAKIDTTLSKCLNQPNHESLEPFLPLSEPKTMELAKDALLIIQLTGFTCGGISVSVSLSHKIGDIATLLIFLHSWTAIARGNEPYLPKWIASSLLPPIDDLPSMSTSLSISKDKFVERRFVFGAAKIAQLKAKARENSILKQQNFYPSRVEVVLALIWKCAATSFKRKSGYFKPSVMFQAVNLRRRVNPPLPDTTMGNLIWPFMVVVREEKEMEIPELVIKMRKEFDEFCENKANNIIGEKGCLMVLESIKERMEFFKYNKDLNVYKCTTWCNFPLYDTDFGWGEPVWHASVNRVASNTISLADTGSRDGIEAVLTLDDEEMTMFQCNEEFLDFACPNPSIPVRIKAAI